MGRGLLCPSGDARQKHSHAEGHKSIDVSGKHRYSFPGSSDAIGSAASVWPSQTHPWKGGARGGEGAKARPRGAASKAVSRRTGCSGAAMRQNGHTAGTAGRTRRTPCDGGADSEGDGFIRQEHSIPPGWAGDAGAVGDARGQWQDCPAAAQQDFAGAEGGIAWQEAYAGARPARMQSAAISHRARLNFFCHANCIDPIMPYFGAQAEGIFSFLTEMRPDWFPTPRFQAPVKPSGSPPVSEWLSCEHISGASSSGSRREPPARSRAESGSSSALSRARRKGGY